MFLFSIEFSDHIATIVGSQLNKHVWIKG